MILKNKLDCYLNKLNKSGFLFYFKIFVASFYMLISFLFVCMSYIFWYSSLFRKIANNQSYDMHPAEGLIYIYIVLIFIFYVYFFIVFLNLVIFKSRKETFQKIYLFFKFFCFYMFFFCIAFFFVWYYLILNFKEHFEIDIILSIFSMGYIVLIVHYLINFRLKDRL